MLSRPIGLLDVGLQVLESATSCREASLSPASFAEDVAPTFVRDANELNAPIVGPNDDLHKNGAIPSLTTNGPPGLRACLVRRSAESAFATLVLPRAWPMPEVVGSPGLIIVPMAALNSWCTVGGDVIVGVFSTPARPRPSERRP
jgi:hypothetical protein